MHLTSIQNTAFTILRNRNLIAMFTPITWDIFRYWSETEEYKFALRQAEYVWKCARQAKQKEKENSNA